MDNEQIYLYFALSLSVGYLHFINIYLLFIRTYIPLEHRFLLCWDNLLIFISNKFFTDLLLVLPMAH